MNIFAQTDKMDLQGITDFITSVGFPIAMCAALFYYMVKQNDKHEHEISSLKDTLNENTQVLTELTTLIRTITK